MKGCMFNIDNGYLEGLCRGFKNGILRQADYLNLVQCETLEDLKLHLQVPVLQIHDFGVDPDPRIHACDKWIRMRIWILLFSSLTFKTSTKN
jgi:hypothetical protein